MNKWRNTLNASTKFWGVIYTFNIQEKMVYGSTFNKLKLHCLDTYKETNFKTGKLK